MTEKIMDLILDYEAYCETQDTVNHQTLIAPMKVVNLFEKKIAEKIRTITKAKGVKLRGLKMSYSQERSVVLDDSKDFFDTVPQITQIRV